MWLFPRERPEISEDLRIEKEFAPSVNLVGPRRDRNWPGNQVIVRGSGLPFRGESIGIAEPR